MRFAILSDIHGNLEAFHTVLDDSNRQKIDGVFCAGDTVGYGPNPQECLDLAQDVMTASVVGNHDWAVTGRLDASYFTEDGRAAIAWTRGLMSFENIQYLSAIPLTYNNKYFDMVHASLFEPTQFHYLTDVLKATEAFSLMESSICFVGHTHVPQTFVLSDGQVTFVESNEIELDSECKYIVNVGSVGQPRDGNPLASYCIYDTELQTISIQRRPYDIKVTQKKIIDVGLPQPLADRLLLGK